MSLLIFDTSPLWDEQIKNDMGEQHGKEWKSLGYSGSEWNKFMITLGINVIFM